jgi:outer membrane protein
MGQERKPVLTTRETGFAILPYDWPDRNPLSPFTAMRFYLRALTALLVAQPLLAQGSGPTLTIEEAVSLAQRNNPQHLQTGTARRRAGAQLRSAYGQLLPSFDVGFGSSYREGRPQFFAGQAFGSNSDVLSSDASVGISAQFSGQNLMGPRQARANLNAADADVTSSAQTLRATVVTQYLNALQAQARSQLQDTLVANTQAQLELARARQLVGAATTLDVRRAEVAVGQAQVQLLRERNNVEIEKLRLFQQMGVPQPPNVELTSQFTVSEPTTNLEELLDMARRQNPTLNARRARERSADVGVAQARSQWLPTLSLQTGVSGFTQQNTDVNVSIDQRKEQIADARAGCFFQDSLRNGAGLPASGNDCNAIVFTPGMENLIRSENEQFPFNFRRSPITFQARLSMPIFDGFTREQRIEEASASRNDARYLVRAQELQLTADVTAAHLNLSAAHRTVALQEQNSQAAREALALAQERFRVGASTFVDLTQARADFERAEADRINAIYDFHKAYATLESAVGRPLR